MKDQMPTYLYEFYKKINKKFLVTKQKEIELTQLLPNIIINNDFTQLRVSLMAKLNANKNSHSKHEILSDRALLPTRRALSNLGLSIAVFNDYDNLADKTALREKIILDVMILKKQLQELDLMDAPIIIQINKLCFDINRIDIIGNQLATCQAAPDKDPLKENSTQEKKYASAQLSFKFDFMQIKEIKPKTTRCCFSLCW